MTLDELKALKDSGQLHHVTYRVDFARGLHIYKVSETGFRGFDYVGWFPEGPEAEAAYQIVRSTGVSVGSYGNG